MKIQVFVKLEKYVFAYLQLNCCRQVNVKDEMNIMSDVLEFNTLTVQINGMTNSKVNCYFILSDVFYNHEYERGRRIQ